MAPAAGSDATLAPNSYRLRWKDEAARATQEERNKTMSRSKTRPAMKERQGSERPPEWMPGPAVDRYDAVWPVRVKRAATMAVLALTGFIFMTPIPAASADILPSPSRPAWDQEPLPEPDPPPEKPFERAAVVGFGLGTLTLALVIARQRGRRAPAKASAGHEAEAL